MAMIYHPNADLSKGEPVIEFTSPPSVTGEKPMRLGMYASDHMVKSWGVTEELKRTDQLKWVGLMNNINQCVKEIIYDEIIYGEIAYGEIVYNGEVYTL